jgi:hypothetical protein
LIVSLFVLTGQRILSGFCFLYAFPYDFAKRSDPVPGYNKLKRDNFLNSPYAFASSA